MSAGPEPRTPSEHVWALRDAILKLEPGQLDNGLRRKACEDLGVTQALEATKAFLAGDSDDSAMTELVRAVCTTDLFPHLLEHLSQLDFEARKDVVRILSRVLGYRAGARSPAVEYVLARRGALVLAAFDGYAREGATDAGTMVRTMISHEALARALLYSDRLEAFPHYIEMGTFDVASDAFASLADLLTRHKVLVAEFLATHDSRVFAVLTTLAQTQNHVIQRRALALLDQVLRERAHFGSMARYVRRPEHLRVIMRLLRSWYPNVQFEAFRVFQIFVANPDKPVEVGEILVRNKDKLVRFFEAFQNDREDDVFNDEKQFLLLQIEKL